MKREKFIDIAKGIAAIFVIMGHCEYTNSTFNAWIYSFHMPLFFIISGWLIVPNKYNKKKEFICKRIKSLIVPYLIFSVPTYIFSNIIELLKTKELNLDILWKRFFGIFIEWVGTDYYCGMWFIIALFFASIISYTILCVIEKLNIKEYKKNIYIILTFICTYILGFIITKYIKGFFWCLNFVPISTSYIILGYALKKLNYNNKIFSHKLFIIPMLVINIIFCYLNYKIAGKTDIYYSNLGNIFYYLISSIAGSMIIIYISKLLNENNILEIIGKHSFYYYALQGCIALPISKITVEYIANKSGILNLKIIIWILIILISVCILEVLSRFIERLLSAILKK